MRPSRSYPLLFAAVALVLSTRTTPAIATTDLPDATLIAHIGERVAAYYRRAERVIYSERSSVIPVGNTGIIPDFARTVESEVRLEFDDELMARVTRQVQRINGREPRESDSTSRSGCTDPTPLSPELLAFLLPTQRDGYRFTALRDGRESGRAALVVDFVSAQRTSRPELIEDEYGHDDCFDWTGPVAIAGRVWVDSETHDVLRLDRRMGGPTDIRVSRRLQDKYHFPTWLTIDRDDLTLRFKPVTFSDPEETMLLPESIESLTMMRTGLQSTRRVQLFSNYRRFLTSGRVR